MNFDGLKRFFLSLRRHKLFNILGSIFLSVAVPFWTEITVEYCIPRPFIQCLQYLVSRPLWAGLAFAALVLSFLFIEWLSARPWIPTLIFTFVGMAANYANYYKKAFRGEPVCFSDIFYMGQATAISKELSMPFTREMILSLIGYLLLLAFSFWIIIPFRHKWKSRLSFAGSALLLCFFFFRCTLFNQNFVFKNGYSLNATKLDIYYVHTFYSSFLVDCGLSVQISEPENYNAETVSQLSQQLQAQQSGTNTPDIIEILLESSYDLELLHQYLDFEDVNVCLHQISQKGGISGNLLVQDYSGGTGDVEFEVLTGFDSADVRLQTVGFEALYEGFPSWIRLLAENGYGCYALHSYTSDLYYRNYAYSDLGFHDSYFFDSFDNPEFVGSYVSDESFVDKIIQLYEEKTQQHDHVFLHGVTMQNHMPYTDPIENSGIDLVPVSGPLSADDLLTVSRFVTRIKLTDAAVEKLISYFSDIDRDVVLILYGDHETQILDSNSQNILSKIGVDLSEEETSKQIHQTDYLVWCNNRQPSVESFGTLTPSVLAAYVAHEYNLKTTNYMCWLYQEASLGSVCGRAGSYAVLHDGNIVYADNNVLNELLPRVCIQFNVINKKGALRDDIQ